MRFWRNVLSGAEYGDSDGENLEANGAWPSKSCSTFSFESETKSESEKSESKSLEKTFVLRTAQLKGRSGAAPLVEATEKYRVRSDT